MIWRLPHALLLVVVAQSAAAQAVRPSFDCAKAATTSEKRICREPALARLDLQIAEAYAAALRLLDDAGKAALRKDQRSFVHVLGIGPDFRDFDLKAQMESRRDFLRRVRATKGEWRGAWANLFGQVEVSSDANGAWTIEVEGAEPINARWICGLSQSGKLTGGAIVTGPDDGVKPEDDPDDGWRHRVSITGDVLKIEPLPPEGKFSAPYCGHNGSIEGSYLPVRPAKTN